MESQLTCPCCTQLYNLLAREPVILTCCGETVCRECFHEKMEQGLSFKCILCESTDNVQLVINRMARKQVEKSLATKTLMVTCDIHDEMLAEYYIKRLNKMVCSKCLVSEYKVHVQESISIDNGRLDSYIKAALEKMQRHNTKVTAIIDTCQGLSQNEKMISSKDFMSLTRDVQTIFNMTGDEEEKKQNEPSHELLSFLFDPQDSPVQKDAKCIPLPDQKYQTSEDSQIKEVRESSDLIREWFGNKNMKLQLEFRATQHGFNLRSLHKRILWKGPTITFIQSEFNQVFGGFCSIPWEHKDQYKPDPTAFIFSLSKKTKHEQYQNYGKAILHDSHFMFCFGRDIAIYPNCDTNKKSYTNIGKTYKPPEGMVYDSNKTPCYNLGGAYNFKVTEIEVYTVIFLN